MTTPTSKVLQARLLQWRYQATAAQERDGEQWYAAARKDVRQLALRYGYPHTLIAAAAAVLSSNISWKQNMLALEALLAGKPCRTFTKACALAIDVLHGDSVVTGRKRQAFAAALAGDDGAIVIDRWMLRAVGLPVGSGMHASRYVKIADALRAAAAVAQEPPAVFQAIIWVTIRAANRQVAA